MISIVQASLRHLSSPDLAPETLQSFVPPIADDFGILVLAEIGPSDDDRGGDGFYVTVCSAKWLARTSLEENPKGFEFVRHRLVIDHWDADLIHRAIRDLCVRTSGASWSEVATKLSRYLAWEFEDYTPG